VVFRLFSIRAHGDAFIIMISSGSLRRGFARTLTPTPLPVGEGLFNT